MAVIQYIIFAYKTNGFQNNEGLIYIFLEQYKDSVSHCFHTFIYIQFVFRIDEKLHHCDSVLIQNTNGN